MNWILVRESLLNMILVWCQQFALPILALISHDSHGDSLFYVLNLRWTLLFGQATCLNLLFCLCLNFISSSVFKENELQRINEGLCDHPVWIGSISCWIWQCCPIFWDFCGETTWSYWYCFGHCVSSFWKDNMCCHAETYDNGWYFGILVIQVLLFFIIDLNGELA